MSTASEQVPMDLGTPVALEGIIVGRSEFSEGPPAYCVEFVRKGRPVRDWFLAGDLAEDGEGGDE